MKICHIFTLTVDLKKTTLYTLEDIYQQTFLAKFQENSTLSGGVDLINESADSLPLKLNQLLSSNKGSSTVGDQKQRKITVYS